MGYDRIIDDGIEFYRDYQAASPYIPKTVKWS